MARFKVFVWLIVAAVLAIYNIFLFAVFNGVAHVQETVFWLIYGLTFAPIILSCVFVTVYSDKMAGKESMHRMPIFWAFSIYFVIALVLSTIFFVMVDRGDVKVLTKAVWIVEAIYLILYIVAMVFVASGAGAMAGAKASTGRKVSFIRSLVASLDAVMPSITDEEARTAVSDLRDNIRYSDPMSNESTAVADARLEECVDNIVHAIEMNAPYGDYSMQIVKAQRILTQRNEMIRSGK